MFEDLTAKELEVYQFYTTYKKKHKRLPFLLLVEDSIDIGWSVLSDILDVLCLRGYLVSGEPESHADLKLAEPFKEYYYGVKWNKAVGKWEADRLNRIKAIEKGFFFSRIDAAKAHDEAAKARPDIYGKKPRLNFRMRRRGKTKG